MTVKRGFEGSFGYSQSGLSGVHRDQTKWIQLKEPPVTTPDIAEINTRLFGPGAYHRITERLQGMFTVTGSFVMALHPTEGIEFLKGLLPSVTSTELTGAGSGIYEHEFVNTDAIPMTEGFSLTIYEDSITQYISGAVVTTIEIGAEINGEVLATVNWVGRKWERAAAGTSGTSQGQSAISFTATLVADTSDQIKLAIDGGTAVEVTITAGAYTTAALLEAAVNTAINGTSGLLDDDGLPEVACYIDSDSKINFYSTDKGTGAEITWTAGSNDANTVLGYGTPVEAAGAAALTTPSYSSVQPYISTQLSTLQDSTAICIESITVTMDAKVGPRNCLGSKYIKGPVLEGKPEITIAFTKMYENESQYTPWLNKTAVDFELNFRTLTAIVAASGVNYDADFYLKNALINNTSAPIFEGQGAMKQEVTATVFYEDATYRNAKFDLNNAMSNMRDD